MLKKAIKKLESYKKFCNKKDGEYKVKLVSMLWSLTDVATLYKDDKQKEVLTYDDVNDLTVEELTQRLDEALKELEKMV